MKNDLRITEQFRAMGTDVAIDLVADHRYADDGKKRIKKTRSFFEEMERKFSRFDVSSELSFVNAHCGAYVSVSEDFLDVLERAFLYHHRSQGLFDPRVHDVLVHAGYDRDFYTQDRDQMNISCDHVCGIHENTKVPLRDCMLIDRSSGMVRVDQKIDLAGIVKSWTVDRARMILAEKNDRGYIIDAGGDMWVQGVDECDHNWYIGIENVDDEKILMKVDGEGVATSGVTRRHWVQNGEKKHHLINPYDKRKFSFDISTVTVIGHTVVEADIWAKTLFLKGIKMGMAYANAHAIKAIFVDQKHNLFISRYAQENII